ncbi:MAG: PQQ-dependent dehydrogenase, methanol/ethanol family [Gemmatimonadales bacterium]
MSNGGRTIRATALSIAGFLTVAANPARGQTTTAAAEPGAGADWPTPGGDLALTRFSRLDRLTPANVAGLKPLWTFDPGIPGPHEGNPLIVDGTMYVLGPFPNTVAAVDLTVPGHPVRWRYAVPAAVARLKLPTGWRDAGTRGLAYHPKGVVLVPLLHGEIAGLDARTGREIWRVKNTDWRSGGTMPGAPLVVKDLVIVGTAGAEYGVRGQMSAYDALTGRLVWRAWHTGPDADVLIDGEANSNYASHRGIDLGVSTWTGAEWQHGGATASGWISYDPGLDLIFYGTDHPGTYNAAQRPGANKWGNTIFARSAATGRVRWALQLTPHDEWGYDASNESLLVDLTIGGRAVKALVHFDRNGFAYTIDRTTGRILIAERFGPLNWASRIDHPSGEPVLAAKYRQGTGKTAGICPAAAGAKGLQAASWSPRTGLFYVPTTDLCMDLTPKAVTYTAGQLYAGATISMSPVPGPSQGRLVAWDATRGSVAWQVPERYPVTGGTLTTAGGLVFYGTMDGWLKAVDQTSGLELWRFKTPSGIIGNPVSFADAAGRQYVAVYSGIGGWIGGTGGPFPDIASIAPPGGVVTVFGLTP